jgi:serine/threonine-protein kinase RsbW
MFKVLKGPSCLKISLSAALENIDKAGDETRKLLIARGIEDQWFQIILVMREALANAIIHGSCSNRQKIISYSLRMKSVCMIIEIEDQGDGFDWQALLRKKPNTTRVGGRGLAIMRKYFSDIEYNDKGNRLILRKKITPRSTTNRH